MALRKDIESKGSKFKDAYIAVVRPTISGDKLRLCFNVQARASDEAEEWLTDEYWQAPYDMEGGNPFEQAYEYLKARPEFEGATDC